MSQPALLEHVIAALERIRLPYMVTGSIASSAQGEPRATHDIDIVVSIPPPAIRSLLAEFPPSDFYLDEQAIRDAIEAGDMFNLVDLNTAEKVDFWVLTDTPFDQSRFARRYRDSFGGLEFALSRPEDTILMKLRWANDSGGSERQFGDALRVYEIQFAKLDFAYMEDWAVRVGVADLWERLKREARPLP